MIFAETASEVSQLLSLVSSFGPAGLAMVAVWFLSRQQEKREASRESAHQTSFAALAASHQRAQDATDKMEKEWMDLERQRIALMTQMVERLGKLENYKLAS